MLAFLRDPDVRIAAAAGRPRLVRASIALFGRALLALFGPLFIGRSIDIVAHRLPESQLYRTVALLVGFALVTAFCQFSMRWLWIGWSRDAELRTRDELFSRLLRFPIPWLDRSKAGELMSRFTSDIEAVRMGYGPGVMHLLQTGTMTIGAIGFMLAQSPWLTVAAVAPLLLLCVFLRWLLPEIHDRSQRVQERQATLSARAHESFSGARVVKAFAREANEELRFAELSRSLLDDNLALARSRALFTCLVEAAGGLAVVIVLLVGGLRVIDGTLAVGAFVAFTGYLNQLVWPMIAIGWTLSLFQRADASVLRLDALREVAPEESPPAGRGGLAGTVRGDIEFRGLDFRYPDASRPALEGISFRIAPGQRLGIVGPTASGKSTIAHLLCRLYDPPRGAVFLDGRDVRDLDPGEIRKAIAVVPQESFLFSDTIAANVGFGVDGATPERIAAAVRAAGLEEDLAAFPDGLETVVGERGITLSGGQRQRTAIARALLVDAPVLVLDDALSAVDTETERRIIERLRPVLASRTAIIVSHRLSAVASADQVIVLEDGRISERGRHDELIARGGLYARLWRLQQDQDALDRL